MGNRRNFIKKASILASGITVGNVLPSSIKKALAIDPDRGTSFYDAEHVVLLMQENRSFDHCFGTLQGVRGFSDPRAITLPDKNLVWLQSNKKGETYLPFRLDINDTKATWMSYLPHSWGSQVAARNGGRHDRWLEAKRSGNKEYADMPLTLGYYTREDIPFYYALADAFTVCDHCFCSSLTGTTPNRLYYWTGTIREKQNEDSPANVNNWFVDYNSPASWRTFPEQLQKNDISWKIYQNELSVGAGLTGQEDSWLANFTNNPLEWFTQYHVQFDKAHLKYLRQSIPAWKEDIRKLEKELLSVSEGDKKYGELKNKIKALNTSVASSEDVLVQWDNGTFEKLPQAEKALHRNAFTTNVNDPFYHDLIPLTYKDHGVERQVNIPKGDVLHQFRKDVDTGKLPTVSWLVAPANFSDHPATPWYGAWYVSEVLDILTKNPEVWKKTIFILTYDENDGYFDHVPPFVAPDPHDSTTGCVSKGIATGVDYISPEQAEKLKGHPKYPGCSSPIGLGYRVPFIVASPWSRGGWVNSQVFDHTSVLQFLEKFLTKKSGKGIEAANISQWRRTVCGDLTSIFRPYQGEKMALPDFVKKKPFIEKIYNTRFKKLPAGYGTLTDEEIRQINQCPGSSSKMPRQEIGVRPSCAIPYQLYADGKLNANNKAFEIRLEAKNEIFRQYAVGAPFNVYAPGRYKEQNESDMIDKYERFEVRNYAVTAGEFLTDSWDIDNNESSHYHLLVYGPNGFFREFEGDASDPAMDIQCDYERDGMDDRVLSGNIKLKIKNLNARKPYTVKITDNVYGNKPVTHLLLAGEYKTIILDLKQSFDWYDITLTISGAHNFIRRCAGHVEKGKESYTDPYMGNLYP